MAGLNNLLSDSQTQVTSMPSWYDAANKDVAAAAKTAYTATPAFADTTAQGAVNTLTGTANPFTQAQGTLNTIATGAANPWLRDTSGAVTGGDPSTALGGLFEAQKSYMTSMLPDIAAKETAGAIGQGGFGSRMNLSGVTRTQSQAMNDLFQKQMQAALQNQQTGVSAATGLGNVGQQGIKSGLDVAEAQAKYPALGAINYANIIKGLTPGSTITKQNQLSAYNQAMGISSILKNMGLGTKEISGLLAKIPGLSNIFGSGGMDLGGGLVLNPDGSVSGGSPNTDSGLSNADLEAQAMGYADAADRAAQEAAAAGGDTTVDIGGGETVPESGGGLDYVEPDYYPPVYDEDYIP